jgi:plasmid stability protein
VPHSLTIDPIDEDLLDELGRAASRQGRAPEDLARDLLAFALRAPPSADREKPDPTPDEVRRRAALLAELRDIRAMTLEPLVFNSTLAIRELRDAW